MTKLLEKDLVYKNIGCAMMVHKELGHGLREKTYERALCLELKYQGIIYSQQSRYPVLYRDETIDEYIPDIEVEDKVIIEIKTVDAIMDEHRGQILNYLRITGLKVGLIIKFRYPKLSRIGVYDTMGTYYTRSCKINKKILAYIRVH